MRHAPIQTDRGKAGKPVLQTQPQRTLLIAYLNRIRRCATQGDPAIDITAMFLRAAAMVDCWENPPGHCYGVIYEPAFSPAVDKAVAVKMKRMMASDVVADPRSRVFNPGLNEAVVTIVRIKKLIRGEIRTIK
jgi:hypothetical protein